MASLATVIGIALGSLAGVLLIVAWLLSHSIFIVKQAEGTRSRRVARGRTDRHARRRASRSPAALLLTLVPRARTAIIIERLGAFRTILTSGIHFVVPFIDQPREFSWRRTYITPDGVIKDETTHDYRVDLRESVFNFLQQEVYTKDTVLVRINALMFYRLIDVKAAVYEVDDLGVALSNTAQTQLKEVFGNMSFSQALESQEMINDHLRVEFGKLFYSWGIHVERMELLDLSPTSDIEENMKKQMIAERTRRGEFIRSEGKKAAMRLKADGEKGAAANLGLAQAEALRKVSEGQYEAAVENASAERKALELIGNSFAADGTSQTDYILSEKYNYLVRDVLKRGKNSHIYLPYEAKAMRGMLADAVNVYGVNATDDIGPAGDAGVRKRAAGRDFSELD